MNKLSLVGMQLPETYKENFNVSGEVPSSGVTSRGHYLHWQRQFTIYECTYCSLTLLITSKLNS